MLLFLLIQKPNEPPNNDLASAGQAFPPVLCGNLRILRFHAAELCPAARRNEGWPSDSNLVWFDHRKLFQNLVAGHSWTIWLQEYKKKLFTTT